MILFGKAGMRSVELFAGAGGLGMGVSNAGFEPVIVIEWDRYCCDTIRENKERGLVPLVRWPLHEGDVRSFQYRAVQGDVDLVSGGPPCQPFSICGKHRGHLDQRDMWPEAVRAVRELRPRAFIFENVKGLTRPAFSHYFEYIKLHLAYPEIAAKNEENWGDHMARLAHHEKNMDKHGKDAGLHYRVASQILNAADYGIPQKRERVFTSKRSGTYPQRPIARKPWYGRKPMRMTIGTGMPSSETRVAMMTNEHERAVQGFVHDPP